MNVEREIREALARIMANVERRLSVPQRSRESINRSCGQIFGKRGRMWKSTNRSEK